MVLQTRCGQQSWLQLVSSCTGTSEKREGTTYCHCAGHFINLSVLESILVHGTLHAVNHMTIGQNAGKRSMSCCILCSVCNIGARKPYQTNGATCILTAAQAVPSTPLNILSWEQHNATACFTAAVTALLIIKHSMLHSSHDSIAHHTAQHASQQP